jgi:hypothetical protein
MRQREVEREEIREEEIRSSPVITYFGLDVDCNM